MKEKFQLDKKQKKVFFKGSELEIFIPDRYKKYGALHVEEFVIAMGVFDMVVDGEETGFFLPATIRIEPSSVDEYNTGADSMTKLTLYDGDLFMTTEFVRNPTLAYNIFNEFINLGKIPDFITYRDTIFMFDVASEVTGMKFGVDHAVWEIIMSYIHRNKNDYSVQHRHTDMNDEPVLIPLRQISVLAESTTSKMLGSFFDQATDSALVNKAEESTELEDILRK